MQQLQQDFRAVVVYGFGHFLWKGACRLLIILEPKGSKSPRRLGEKPPVTIKPTPPHARQVLSQLAKVPRAIFRPVCIEPIMMRFLKVVKPRSKAQEYADRNCSWITLIGLVRCFVGFKARDANPYDFGYQWQPVQVDGK